MLTITIETVNLPYITFNSSIGKGMGLWQGHDSPLTGQIYNIELTINKVFEYNKNIYLFNNGTDNIHIENNNIKIVAKIIYYEVDDHILTISLNGLIILLEVSNFPNIQGHISFINKPQDILIYPYLL